MRVESLMSGAWRDLVLINFEVDPQVLRDRIPVGTRLDVHNGIPMVSLVGVRFTGLRIMGVPVPLHQDFVQVNLRFYVRCATPSGNRPGVSFIRQIVPSPLIAFGAHAGLNETMTVGWVRSKVRKPDDPAAGSITYEWRNRGEACRVTAQFAGPPRVPDDGSEALFVTERHWGYSRQRDGSTIEYRVDHPRWAVWNATSCRLEGKMVRPFGIDIAGALATPRSALVATGSEIGFPPVVRRIRPVGRRWSVGRDIFTEERR